MLPKTSAYVKCYDGQSNWMYFLIEDDNLLEKYNTIWDKVSPDIKKESDSEPVYDKNYLKIKIKSHGDKVTDFYDKKIHKLDSNHTQITMCYPQVFLKECKYIEKKVIRHIHANLSDFFFLMSLMRNRLKLSG